MRGVDLYITSSVPIGAGLSSSAAIECAVALALDEHWGLGFDRATLAKVGQLAENRVVGAPTGIMDQSASLLGEADAGVFLDCRSLDADVIPLGFSADGLSLLVIDTKVEHAHASGGYAARRASCEARRGGPRRRVAARPAARRPRAGRRAARRRDVPPRPPRGHRGPAGARHRAHPARAGPGAIGPFLDASHVSMRDDFEISVPELDLAVATAQANGAIGARMTGGGFGGSAIALVIDALVPVVTREVLAAFAEHGYREPSIFAVHPSQGARRDA